MHIVPCILRLGRLIGVSCLAAHGAVFGASGDSDQSPLGIWFFQLTPGKVVLGVFILGAMFRVLSVVLGFRVHVPHVVAVQARESSADLLTSDNAPGDPAAPRYAAGSEGADELAKTPVVAVRIAFLWLAAGFCCLMMVWLGIALKMHSHLADPDLWRLAGMAPLILTVGWWVARQLWIRRGNHLPPVPSLHMNLAMRLSILLFVAVMLSHPVESIGEWAVWIYDVVFAIFGFRQVESSLRRRG